MITRYFVSALVLACAATANANTVTIAVPYGDVDLSTLDGRKTLDDRLARATRKVCGGYTPVRALWQMQSYRACISDARASYQNKVEVALNNANVRKVKVAAQ